MHKATKVILHDQGQAFNFKQKYAGLNHSTSKGGVTKKSPLEKYHPKPKETEEQKYDHFV